LLHATPLFFLFSFDLFQLVSTYFLSRDTISSSGGGRADQWSRVLGVADRRTRAAIVPCLVTRRVWLYNLTAVAVNPATGDGDFCHFDHQSGGLL
jgi:hypothetical protein